MLAREYLPQQTILHLLLAAFQQTHVQKTDLGQLLLLKHHYFLGFQRQSHLVELRDIHKFKIPSDQTKLDYDL